MALNDDSRAGAPGSAERDHGLDRIYRLTGHEDPPARLDAAILAAARREVGARPRPVSARLRAWRVPVSVAALVVLSVSMVTLVREEGGEHLMKASPETIPPTPPVTQPVQPVPALPEKAQARPPNAAPVPMSPPPREDERAGAPASLGRMTDSVAGGTGPAESQGAGTVIAPDTAPKPQPFRDTASMAEGRRPPASLDTSLQEVLSAAPPPAAAERRAAPVAAASAPEPASAQAMMQARKEAAPGDDKLPVWHGFEKEPPQKWFERIAELKRQQRAAEAEAMLAEFKRRFPGHPLPPGLQ
jgi:hypothetical protein